MDRFPPRDSRGKGHLRANARDPVVLDTNAVSLLLQGGEECSRLVERIRGRPGVVSFQTVEEAWFGAFKARWGSRRRNELKRHLRKFKVIWPNAELVEVCAHLRAEQSAVGRRLSVDDAWIAATALYLKYPLVSGDSDFASVANLELIRP